MSQARDRWPQILREIAEDLGECEALRLAGAIGGQRVHIPYTNAPARFDTLVGCSTPGSPKRPAPTACS